MAAIADDYDYEMIQETKITIIHQENFTVSHLHLSNISKSVINEWNPAQNNTVNKVVQHALMGVCYPATVAVSSVVFGEILRNKKIRTEPWRWLIAHTCLCIFMTTFSLFLNGFTTVYHLPSLDTSALCPVAKFIEHMFWHMALVSFGWVIIERFKAMRRDDWKQGGMGKKAVIISLAVSWGVTLILGSINLGVYGTNTFQMKKFGIKHVCAIAKSTVTTVTLVIIEIWLATSVTVGIIGSVVYAIKKKDENLKKEVIIPTLVISFSCVVFYFGTYIMALLRFPCLYCSLSLLTINWDVFATTWITVWTKNGEMDWKDLIKSCTKKTDEETQLLDKKPTKENPETKEK